MEDWLRQDGRVVLDVVAARVVIAAGGLVLQKAFLEPIAAWIGQQGYKRLDAATGDRLPDLPGTEKDE